MLTNFKNLVRKIGRFLALPLTKIGTWLKSVFTSLVRLVSPYGRRLMDVFGGEIVTINIEDSEVRILVISGNKIKRWESVSLEQGTVKDGLVLDSQAVGSAIDQLLETKRFKRRKVIISLSGFQSVYRIIELPKMPKKLLSKAIMNEAKQTMPVSLEQLYLSWHKISEENGIQRFFLLGTPKNLLDSKVKCLHTSKIKPRSMNTKPIALAGLTGCPEALIIDIEPESCEIILIAGGIPAIMRSIPMHAEYNSSERAQFVLQEFERTLGYFETNYPDYNLNRDTPFFISGKLASDELAQTIANGVGLNVKPLESPLKCPDDFPLAQYATNVGLALKGRAIRSKAGEDRFMITNINILPQEYLPKSLSTKQTLSLCGLVVGIFLIFPLYQVGNSASNDVSQLQREYSAVLRSYNAQQGRVIEARRIQENIDTVEETKEYLISILEDFQQIGEQRLRAYELLCISSRYSPAGVLPMNATLITVSQEVGKLTLIGTASSCEVAIDYADALTRVDGFSNVQIHSLIDKGEIDGMVQFNISLEWE